MPKVISDLTVLEHHKDHVVSPYSAQSEITMPTARAKIYDELSEIYKEQKDFDIEYFLPLAIDLLEEIWLEVCVDQSKPRLRLATNHGNILDTYPEEIPHV